MKISTDHVRKVAQLARLELSEQEVELFAGQLDAILGYMAQLDELDTDGVEGTSHVVPRMACSWREDRLARTVDAQEIVARAPRGEQGFFRVPKIIE